MNAQNEPVTTDVAADRATTLIRDAVENLPTDVRQMVDDKGFEKYVENEQLVLSVTGIPFAFIPLSVLYDPNATGAIVERIDPTVPDTIPEAWTGD